MTPDQYLRNMLARYSIQNNPNRITLLNLAISEVTTIIRNWAGQQLARVDLSGSNAKGTAITLSHDVDLFISLHSNTTETLKELHRKLNVRLTNAGYSTQLQNVSIGIIHNGFKLDLVPAVKQSPLTLDHSLYRRKQDSWTKTNIHTHITKVRNSRVKDEIKIMKIWRELNNIDFPSFYLEITVINALGIFPSASLSTNIIKVLTYLRDSFVNARVVDPANTNNIISDDLTVAEKNLIRDKARYSLGQATWAQIIK